MQRVVGRGVLHFAGIHCHIGSQVFRLDSFERAVEKMVGLVHAIETETGAPVDELNLGGGLGVRYLPEDAPPTIEQYATVVRESVGKALADAGVRSRPRLLTEPGRSIVAPAGITLYTIGTIKAIDGVRTYVAVDGGMSDNLRPVTYGARYEAFLPGAGDGRAVGARDDRGQALRAGRHHRARRAAAGRPRDRRRARHAGHRRVRPLDGVQLQQGDAARGRVRARRRGAGRRAARDRIGSGPARHRRPNLAFRARFLRAPSPRFACVALRGETMASTMRGRRAARRGRSRAARRVHARAGDGAPGSAPSQIERRVRTRRVGARAAARLPARGDAGVERCCRTGRRCCGPGPSCALSHTSAAAIWRIRDAPRSRRPELIVPRDARAARRRASSFTASRGSTPTTSSASRGLPVTSPARTIIDLAGVLADADLEARRSSARRARGLVTVRAVRVRLDEIGAVGRPGAARLRALLAADRFGAGRTHPQEWRGDGRRAGRIAGLWERGRGARAPARLQRRPHHATLRRAARGRAGRGAQRRQGARRRPRAGRAHQRRRRGGRATPTSTSSSRSSAASSPRAA